MAGPSSADVGDPDDLGVDECQALLTTTTVGRMAFVDAHGRQQLLPMNFVVRDHVIYLRTSETGLLAGVVNGATEVAFGVDYHAEMFPQGWSVVAAGHPEILPDGPERDAVLADTHLSPWASGQRQVVIALRPRSLTGRRVRR